MFGVSLSLVNSEVEKRNPVLVYLDSLAGKQQLFVPCWLLHLENLFGWGILLACGQRYVMCIKSLLVMNIFGFPFGKPFVYRMNGF